MGIKIKKKESVDVSTGALRGMASTYLELNSEIKELTTKKAKINKELKEQCMKLGTKDDKDSLLMELDGIIIKNEARISVRLNEDEAEALLKKKKLWKDCVKTITVIDEDKLSSLYTLNKLSDNEMKSITTKSTIYALKVTKK